MLPMALNTLFRPLASWPMPASNGGKGNQNQNQKVFHQALAGIIPVPWAARPRRKLCFQKQGT